MPLLQGELFYLTDPEVSTEVKLNYQKGKFLRGSSKASTQEGANNIGPAYLNECVTVSNVL